MTNENNDKEKKEPTKLIKTINDRRKWTKDLKATKLSSRQDATLTIHVDAELSAQIKELSDLTGESNNKICARLVHIALNRRNQEVSKLAWQKKSLERIENKLQEIERAGGKTLTELGDLKKQQQKHQKMLATMFAETYAAIYLAMSYARLTLAYVIGQIQNLADPSPRIVEIVNQSTEAFIGKGVAEIEQLFAHHKQATELQNIRQIFPTTKLRRKEPNKDSAPHTDPANKTESTS